jgi:hypothetical protein
MVRFVVPRAQSALASTPAPLTNSGTMAATLTTPYGPVAGVTLTFSSGGTDICSALTSASGTASCGGLGDEVTLVLNDGYTVRFAGSPQYARASARGAP